MNLVLCLDLFIILVLIGFIAYMHINSFKNVTIINNKLIDIIENSFISDIKALKDIQSEQLKEFDRKIKEINNSFLNNKDNKEKTEIIDNNKAKIADEKPNLNIKTPDLEYTTEDYATVSKKPKEVKKDNKNEEKKEETKTKTLNYKTDSKGRKIIDAKEFEKHFFSNN